MAILDTYNESNTSVNANVYSTVSMVGQSFTLSNPSRITSIKFYIYKAGSPTGNCSAKIYNHFGVYGTSSTGTGSVLATSDTLDVSTLETDTYHLVEFSFSGEQIRLFSAGYFVCVLNYSGGDTSNRIRIGTDNTSPTHSGNMVYYDSQWRSSTSDVIFYVYGDYLPIVGNSYPLTAFGNV